MPCCCWNPYAEEKFGGSTLANPQGSAWWAPATTGVRLLKQEAAGGTSCIPAVLLTVNLWGHLELLQRVMAYLVRL
jgi:hypothetical protein